MAFVEGLSVGYEGAGAGQNDWKGVGLSNWVIRGSRDGREGLGQWQGEGLGRCRGPGSHLGSGQWDAPRVGLAPPRRPLDVRGWGSGPRCRAGPGGHAPAEAMGPGGRSWGAVGGGEDELGGGPSSLELRRFTVRRHESPFTLFVGRRRPSSGDK